MPAAFRAFKPCFARSKRNMAVHRRNSNTTVRSFRNKTAGTLGDSAFFKLAGGGTKCFVNPLWFISKASVPSEDCIQKTCKNDRKRRRTLLSVKILVRVFLQNLTKNAVNSRASVPQAHSQKVGNRMLVKYLAIAQCEIKVAF